MSIILFAIPIFFLLIAIELIVDKKRKTHFYRLNDAITSLSIGALSRVIGAVKNLVPFTVYILVFEHFALFEQQNTGFLWLSVFVLYDFLYYWSHRCGHEISIFWAAHVVHHSSEDYNLTTALRQTSGSFLNFVFFLPLALLGVEPALLLSVASLNLVYQFWVHTQHIDKLGFIEWFLVSPSNHRVHHAQNQIYLDRNYGGVFIVWDRIFGTYQEELDEEKPVYGVRKALKSWDPFYANIQVYSLLFKDSLLTKKWFDKIRVWFGRTAWRPLDMIEKFPMENTDLNQFVPYQTKITLFSKVYVLTQYFLISAMALFLLLNVDSIASLDQVVLAAFVICASVNLAYIMEDKYIAIYFEWIKFIALALLVEHLSEGKVNVYLFIPLVASIVMLMQLHFRFVRKFRQTKLS